MIGTSIRTKKFQNRRGCLMCHSIGAASPSFAYVEVEYMGMVKVRDWTKGGDKEKRIVQVVKEIGLCFKHCKPRTDNNPSGLLDPEIGEWKKTPFGKMPVRDGLYQLVGGRIDGAKLLTGVAGKIPRWW